jgi:hypothetical protein
MVALIKCPRLTGRLFFGGALHRDHPLLPDPVVLPRRLYEHKDDHKDADKDDDTGTTSI